MYNQVLDTYVKVYETGSFLKASQSLFISATSIKKQIDNLENRYNCKFFKRTNKGCIPTKKGKLFYDGALKIIELSNNMEKELLNDKKIDIKIGITFFNRAETFLNKWNEIKTKYPQYRIKLELLGDSFSSSLRENLNYIDNRGDFLIIPKNNAGYLYKNYEFKSLSKEELCLLLNSDDPLLDNKIIKFSDLSNRTIVTINSKYFDATDYLISNIKKESRNINIEEVTDITFDSLNEIINSNKLVIGPKFWQDLLPNLVTIPFENVYSIEYCILYKKNPNLKIVNFLKIFN